MLDREAGQQFTCYYDPKGLPEKLIHFPDLKGDAPAKPHITMRLVVYEGGNKLEAYLQEMGLKTGGRQLTLEPGVDFVRHGNGERGGLLYFDICTKGAVEKLFDRAKALSDAPDQPWTDRVNQSPPSERKR